jgi:ethanolamine ammonia-lyase small subunit
MRHGKEERKARCGIRGGKQKKKKKKKRDITFIRIARGSAGGRRKTGATSTMRSRFSSYEISSGRDGICREYDGRHGSSSGHT